MPKGACDGDDGWGLRGSISTEFFEELRDGLAAAGIAEIGCDFVEGDEDEGTLGEARMGDFEAGFAKDEIAVEENVEIEGARAIGNTGPPQTSSDPAQYLHCALPQVPRCSVHPYANSPRTDATRKWWLTAY